MRRGAWGPIPSHVPVGNPPSPPRASQDARLPSPSSSQRLRALLTAPSWGSRRSQPKALAPGGGYASGRSPLPQPPPPPAEATRKFTRDLAPLRHGPAWEAGPSAPPAAAAPEAALGGAAPRRGSGGRGRPLARRGRGLPAPLGPRRSAGCLQRPRGPLSPPCALLTSFILSHPHPPTLFPNSDSLPAPWQQRRLLLLWWLSRRRAEPEKPVRLLKKTPADPPLSQPLKVQGRRGLAGGRIGSRQKG